MKINFGKNGVLGLIIGLIVGLLLGVFGLVLFLVIGIIYYFLLAKNKDDAMNFIIFGLIGAIIGIIISVIIWSATGLIK